MKTTINSYRQVKKIKDEKFDIDQMHHYDLSLQMGSNDFQLLVTDPRTNFCVLLEDYVFEDTGNYLGILTLLFDEHPVLTAGFWNSVRFSQKNQKFSLIPQHLFDPDNLKDYLWFNCETDSNLDEYFFNKSLYSDAVTVFAIDKNLVNFLKKVYPNINIQFLHQGNALIQGVFKNNDSSKNMFLFVERMTLNVIVTENQNLLFYNRYSFKNLEQFVKFIMIVVQELKLNPKTSKVTMWGQIGPKSEFFNELYKYIVNVSFGKRPNFLKFNYVFDETEDHQYFDLYSMNLC